MSYKIKTDNAAQKLATMISCVKKRKDESGREIDTWQIDGRSGANSGFFIHTEQQWEEKGYIHCSLSKLREDILLVCFEYWDECEEENKSDDDEGILLGRFTELLINHFADLNIKIKIEP